MARKQVIHAGFKAFPKKYIVKHWTGTGGNNTTIGSIIAMSRDYFTVNTDGLDTDIKYDNIISFKEAR